MDIREALACAKDLQSDTALLDVECILAHVLDKDRTFLRTWPETTLSKENTLQFKQLLERRKSGEPIAYILGFREFWTLTLKVNESTLIPRPDTELIVECVLSLPLDANAKVLDLGTGTGAIALALAKERPQWSVSGVDRVDGAVVLATQNANLNLISNVHFFQSDWFSNVPENKLDLIVSNPPYIDDSDPHLSTGDVRFEPRSALVAEDRGLADISYIAGESLRYLGGGAYLVLEHGYDQGEKVRNILKKEGYQGVQTFRDIGHNERVTLGRFEHV